MNQSPDVEPLPRGTRLGGFIVDQLLEGHNPATLTYVAQDSAGRVHVVKEYAAARNGTGNGDDEQGELRHGLRAFATDAHLLSSLQSSARVPGLVAMRDLFKENGTVYAVMDLEPGTPLAHMLERGERPGEADLVRWAHQLAAALAAAHEAGVVHGAIRPSDIIIRPDGDATLVGFCSRNGSRGGVTAGPDPYAAPEERDGTQPPSTAGDLYALGATLHHCVTGTAPPPVPPRLGEGGGQGFAHAFLAAIDVATAPDPRARPSGPAEWLALLPEPPARTAPPPSPERAPPAAGAPAKAVPDPSEPVLVVKHRRTPLGAQASWLAAGVGLLLLVGAVVAALVLGGRGGVPDLAELDRTLARSRATVEALEHETTQILVDGVRAPQVEPARRAALQARAAFAEQVEARNALASTRDASETERLSDEFSAAAAKLSAAELTALKGLIAAYRADAENRFQGVIGPVPKARMALAGLPESSGGELASRMDVVLRLLTRSQAKLRSVAEELRSVTDPARAHQLLREAKLAYHANTEAHAHLSGLLRDASRAVEIERSQREAYEATQRRLDDAVAGARAAARNVIALAGRARARNPELAPLAESARQRADSLEVIEDLAEADNLDTLRTALAEARLAEADLTAMLADARRLSRDTRTTTASAARVAETPAPARRAKQRPTRNDATRSPSEIRRQAARDFDAVADRYRDLRRELSRAYRSDGSPARNASRYAEADRLYAALLNLRELKRIVDDARSPQQAELAYREFAQSHGRLEAGMRSLRRDLAQQ